MVRRALLLGLSLVAVGLSGCGGSDEPPLTRPELVSKADAICRSMNAKIKALGTPKTLPDLQRIGGQVRSVSDDGVKQLLDLKVPDDFADEWERMMALAGRSTGYAGELAAAAKAKDPQKVRSIAVAGRRTTLRFDALAKRHGFHDCATG
jgi:pimeloyl-ACP methyl ester carboxylesterase